MVKAVLRWVIISSALCSLVIREHLQMPCKDHRKAQARHQNVRALCNNSSSN